MSISNKRLGMVGIGVMGHGIAANLAGHGYSLVFLDHPGNQPVDDLVAAGARPVAGLSELAAESDIVILCVPLTETTRGMIDAPTLAAMKPGAVLINVARGQVVVESALVEALITGHLSGAGLDVTEVEPLPPSSRLWNLPNVIITPHVGAQSRTRYDDATRLFAENLGRYLRHEPLVNVVDKRLGFPKR